ncbi:MAG: glycosyltransferase family 39 protein [bacterium]
MNREDSDQAGGALDAQMPVVAESIWWSLTISLTTWSLLAVALARLGLFQDWTMLTAGLLACIAGGTFWLTQEVSDAQRSHREALFPLLILGLGLLLFCWPSEHFPQLGDSSIYPNTASNLIGSGGLTYHYAPFDGLSPEQKQLFYVPSDEQWSHIDIESYDGLLYGVYYVMNPAQNTVVASRPPLPVTWMGLFGLLGGPRGMLYVTPLFGTASLVTVYFLGKRLFNASVGALAALWLLLSFPQLHFSRAPYAEVVGQFFVLTALYGLVTYLQTTRLKYVLVGVAALIAGFAARLDVILFVPVLFLFIFFLLVRHHTQALATCGASAAIGVGFTLWTLNEPYVGATGELLFRGQLRFLYHMSPCFLTGVGLAGLLGLAGLRGLLSRIPPRRRERFIRWGVLLVVVAGVGYALHIRPARPEYLVVDDKMIGTHNEELMALAAQYMSYPFFWLAASGTILLFWQQRIGHDQLLFAFFVVFFAAAFFWKYTTASVYPAALRRLVPEVLPGCALLGAFALQRLGHRGPRWSEVVLAGLVIVLLVSLAGRYWFYREAEQAWDTIDQLADSVPTDAIIIFEPRTEQSIVGSFAAPLWSFHQREALLLNSGEISGDTLRKAICFWQNEERDVYVVSQHAPSNWWPGQFEGHRQEMVVWDSSIIGQSRRFPPYVWRFSFTFPIYRLERASCSGDR